MPRGRRGSLERNHLSVIPEKKKTRKNQGDGVRNMTFIREQKPKISENRENRQKESKSEGGRRKKTKKRTGDRSETKGRRRRTDCVCRGREIS